MPQCYRSTINQTIKNLRATTTTRRYITKTKKRNDERNDGTEMEQNRNNKPKRNYEGSNETERRNRNDKRNAGSSWFTVCTVRNTVRVEIIPIKNTESQLIYIISLLIKKRIEPLPFLLL